MHAITRGINDRRSHEDQQIPLERVRRFAPKEPADKGQIPKHRNFVFDTGDVFRNEPAQNHRLAVPHHGTRHHLAQPEYRERLSRSQRIADADPDRLRLGLKERSRLSVVSDEFLDRRNDCHLDGVAIGRHVRDHVKHRAKFELLDYHLNSGRNALDRSYLLGSQSVFNRHDEEYRCNESSQFHRVG